MSVVALQSNRSRSFSAARQPTQAVRPQFDQPNWRCWSRLRSWELALLAQGDNFAADMRGQLVGLRFTPSIG